MGNKKRKKTSYVNQKIPLMGNQHLRKEIKHRNAVFSQFTNLTPTERYLFLRKRFDAQLQKEKLKYTSNSTSSALEVSTSFQNAQVIEIPTRQRILSTSYAIANYLQSKRNNLVYYNSNNNISSEEMNGLFNVFLIEIIKKVDNYYHPAIAKYFHEGYITLLGTAVNATTVEEIENTCTQSETQYLDKMIEFEQSVDCPVVRAFPSVFLNFETFVLKDPSWIKLIKENLTVLNEVAEAFALPFQTAYQWAVFIYWYLSSQQQSYYYNLIDQQINPSSELINTQDALIQRVDQIQKKFKQLNNTNIKHNTHLLGYVLSPVTTLAVLFTSTLGFVLTSSSPEDRAVYRVCEGIVLKHYVHWIDSHQHLICVKEWGDANKGDKRASSPNTEAQPKKLPPRYHTIYLDHKTTYITPTVETTPPPVEESSEKRTYTQWRYRTDCRGHIRLTVRRGKLPLDEQLRHKLIHGPRNSLRPYAIYEHPDDVLPKELVEQLTLRGLPLKQPDEWLAVLTTQVKNCVRGPKDAPYIPAIYKSRKESFNK